jgi:aryl-alcohol dehydrogenase-like predicted oxidoreductase
VGLAIRGRPRSSFVLATKTHTRTAADARRDLEKSLVRLGVEQIDLVQVHAVGDAADMERALLAATLPHRGASTEWYKRQD